MSRCPRTHTLKCVFVELRECEHTVCVCTESTLILTEKPFSFYEKTVYEDGSRKREGEGDLPVVCLPAITRLAMATE